MRIPAELKARTMYDLGFCFTIDTDTPVHLEADEILAAIARFVDALAGGTVTHIQLEAFAVQPASQLLEDVLGALESQPGATHPDCVTTEADL